MKLAKPTAPKPAPLSTHPCIYRGDPTGERVQCGTCGDGVMLPVQACGVHGRCVVAKTPKDPSVKCCKDCPQRVEPTSDVTRALIEAGTDKHRIHGYGPMYASLVAGRDIRSILEIGVLRGESIRAWKRLFPRAEIAATDVDPSAAAHVAGIPGVRFVLLDVSDSASLIRFAREHRDRFDLVIDDATHKAAHQVAAKRHLLPCVRPGGVMVIEDVPNDAAAAALGGKVWDFREVGRWDSRAVSIERPVRPRALLCGQYLERDGAPIVLSNLARNLTAWHVAVHSPHDGPLRDGIEAAGVPVNIGREPDLAGVDLVVANTLAAAYAVRAAKDAGLPCVWLIHESDPAMCGNLDDVRDLIGYPKLVVFPCQATADAYAGLRAEGVRIVPSIIPRVPDRTEEPAFRRFHIVTFGRDEPRKGQADIRAAVEGDPTIR
ncbi:MAG: class I SAM-dependent methyltransferase [Gemmataceae bacterium]